MFSLLNHDSIGQAVGRMTVDIICADIPFRSECHITSPLAKGKRDDRQMPHKSDLVKAVKNLVSRGLGLGKDK